MFAVSGVAAGQEAEYEVAVGVGIAEFRQNGLWDQASGSARTALAKKNSERVGPWDAADPDENLIIRNWPFAYFQTVQLNDQLQRAELNRLGRLLSRRLRRLRSAEAG